MATAPSIPRFLLPRLAPIARSRTHVIVPRTAARHASYTAKGLSEEFRRRQEALQKKGTPVIPQPDKYRPPSHSKRSPNRNLENRIYGPPVSEEDKKRMATKKYPNMMSPEGTFSHWFFHNKAIHVWITFGTLTSLAIAAWYMDFRQKTVYGDLLPDRKDFIHHPIQSCKRSVEVYKMHVEQQSEVVAEIRLKKTEDLEKRKQFRAERQREAEERGEEYVIDPRYYVGEDGIRRRRVKRWFGIWE